MAFLEQFSDDERELIVSLPYRAGLWVSSSDNVGGAKADYHELDTLETVIAEKGRGMFESAFVHEVMAETCTRQDDWKKWAENRETVLSDCGAVIKVIGDKLTEKDIDAYRLNVMAIGLAVAKAFRELGAEASLFEKMTIQLRVFGDAVVRRLQRDKSWDSQSVLNVSIDEDKALTALSEALHPEV